MENVPQKTALLTAVMTAWLVLTVIFAGIFVIVEHYHDHTSANCRICLEIEVVQKLIEAFARLGLSILFAGFINFAIPLVKPRIFIFALKPFALKVKLNC